MSVRDSRSSSSKSTSAGSYTVLIACWTMRGSDPITARVVERQVPVARAALETDEHHERRRYQTVEAEVVGPARAHGRGEVEAGLGEERARPLGQGGVVDRGGFALGDL